MNQSKYNFRSEDRDDCLSKHQFKAKKLKWSIEPEQAIQEDLEQS